MEANLVAERGFAGTGGALNDVKAAFEKAAAQNDIEAGNPTGHPLEFAAVHLAHGWLTSTCRGSVTVNTDPPPWASSTLIVPPMASTSWPTTHKPTPKPLRRSSDPTARSKRPKMRLRSSMEMPGPWSRTRTQTVSPRSSAQTSTGWRAPYLMALETRLSMIC